MMKLNDFISLSEKKTASVKFSIDWTKTFEGIKIPHRTKNCLDCDNEKVCSDYCILTLKKCFICEVERASESRLDPLSQKKTIFCGYPKKAIKCFHGI